jgi:tetratricopeptide (TPR) repeat protein
VSIRYCLKCDSIFNDSKSLFLNELYYCVQCNQVLIYFGREVGFVSEKIILDAYDLLHPFQPVKDFKGVYKSYGSVAIDRGVLECEDILKNFPHDRNALFYLSKYYWNLNELKKSWHFFSNLLDNFELESEEAEFYVNYLLYKKEYSTILTFLDVSKTRFNQFFLFHYQGIANLAIGKYKKALLNFYRSLSYCKDTVREKKIKDIIKKLNAYIESR